MLKDDINSVYFYQCYQYGSVLMPHQKNTTDQYHVIT